MKALLVGEALSNSGYCRGLHSYAVALDSVGWDVAVRNVSMTTPKGQLNPKIQRYLDNNLDNVDVVFQFNLPTEFAHYKNGFKNIGGFAYETDLLPRQWELCLKDLDNIIVPSETKYKMPYKTSVVPHAIGIKKFKDNYPQMFFGCSDKTVKFYTISEFNTRKNVQSLIFAYLSEFNSSDDVCLIIKCHVPGASREQSHGIIKKHIQEIRTSIGKYSNQERYPKIVLIPDFLSEEAINCLHANCEVYVTATRGEAFGFPAFDAYGFGNRVIVPYDGAFKQYFGFDFDQNVGFINGFQQPCFATDVVQGLYTDKENWFICNVSHLRQQMRLAYGNHKGKQKKQAEYIEKLFGYEQVGKLLEKAFNE